jgi:cGMP-dependent protein kinase
MYKRAQTQQLNLEDEEELDLSDIRLSEFEVLGTLGVGGFGRVELVKNSRDQRTYALKILKKQHVVETKQQDHVLNERNIMMGARSNFISRLYKTFKDKKVNFFDWTYFLIQVKYRSYFFILHRNRIF